jgi:putative transposase
MQLSLAFTRPKQRGGARIGAGRKRLPPGLRHTPHRSRAVHRAAYPVHVTMRAGLRSLRHQFVAQTVLTALQSANRAEFRVVHWSIQPNHLHLIVEAQSPQSLSSGMRGLAVRLARRINRLLFRRGSLWADRWFGVELTSPRQVRNALVYVLQNHAKHSASHRPARDPLSSARIFDGFATAQRGASASRAGPSGARTWLLRIGWKRHGLIRHDEVPVH